MAAATAASGVGVDFVACAVLTPARGKLFGVADGTPFGFGGAFVAK